MYFFRQPASNDSMGNSCGASSQTHQRKVVSCGFPVNERRARSLGPCAWRHLVLSAWIPLSPGLRKKFSRPRVLTCPFLRQPMVPCLNDCDDCACILPQDRRSRRCHPCQGLQGLFTTNATHGVSCAGQLAGRFIRMRPT